MILTSVKDMKSIKACVIVMCAMVSVCQAELSPRDLLKQIREVFGPEWTVSTDFDSMVAIRRDAKLLGKQSRIAPVLLKEGEDLWDDSISSDCMICVFMRPKLTETEFRQLSALRDHLIETRKKDFPVNPKDAFGELEAARGAITLPGFHLGDRAIYFRCTADQRFDVRPENIAACRDQVLGILQKECRSYVPDAGSPAGNGKR